MSARSVGLVVVKMSTQIVPAFSYALLQTSGGGVGGFGTNGGRSPVALEEGSQNGIVP